MKESNGLKFKKRKEFLTNDSLLVRLQKMSDEESEHDEAEEIEGENKSGY